MTIPWKSTVFTAIAKILDIKWCTVFTIFTIYSLNIYKIKIQKNLEILTILNISVVRAGTFLKMY